MAFKVIFLFKQKTAYEFVMLLKFRRVLFRSINHIPMLALLDAFALGVPLAQAFGRLDRKSVV